MKFARLFCILCLALAVFAVGMSTAYAAETPVYDILLGDMDETGSLSAADARIVLRASVKLENLDEYMSIVADADLNGQVSAADARIVLRASVKLEDITKFYHIHTNEDPVPVDGGCLLPSYTETVCTTCKMRQLTDLVPAAGHKWSAYLFDGKGNHARECSVCNTVENTACSLEITETPADCINNGYKTGVCSVCKWETVTDEIAALGHDYTPIVKAPTCSMEGGTYWTCTRCEDTYLTDNVPATGHSYAYIDIAGDCTHEKYTLEYCNNCEDYSQKLNVVPAPGHNFKWAKNADGVYMRTCANAGCKEQPHAATKAGTLAWFNDTVNKLKSEEQYEQDVTILRYTKNVNYSDNYNFGINTFLVESLMKDTLNTTLEDYKAPAYNRVLTYNTFPTMAKEYVSRLEDGEVNSVTVTENQKVDVLKDFPASYEVKKGDTTTTYDISEFKNKVIDNAVKVRVVVNTDKATLLKKDPNGNTYAFSCGPITYTGGSDTATAHFYGLSMDELCEKFPQRQVQENEEHKETMITTMDCSLVTSDMVADWYFDAETLQPIACIYNVTIFLDQNVELEMKNLLISGTFDLDTTITYKYAYLFSNYYSESE